jgi:NADPH-dependent 2,4-dienoyl-CoA reductase/sulfur reductase-like enzyme
MRGDRWWRYALSAQGAEIVHEALDENGVTPVFDSGVDRFETDDDGTAVAAITPDGDRYEGEFVGVAIGLDFNTEFLQETPVELDGGIVVDEHMRTDVEDVYAAGDITQFWDVILDDRTQNGAWGSAKQQGVVAGKNMAADADEEVFRWVSSYSITHFDFPFLSFGHPTIGDDECEAAYDEGEWRRLTFTDGQLVGGVLIGDLSQQSKYKRLIRGEVPVADRKDLLLEKDVDLDRIMELVSPEAE